MKERPSVEVARGRPANRLPDIVSRGHPIRRRSGEVGVWKENLAMQTTPTDAYGSIQFDGSLSKAAKYIRLGPGTEMAAVKELLTERWGLTRPTPHLALGCTALHCTALHCTALHCITLHCTALQYRRWGEELPAGREEEGGVQARPHR